MSVTLDNFELSTSPRARVIAALRERIACGQLRPGERLPAEQTLAEHFSVSRGTLRMALAGLEQQGLVRRRPNQGCVVAPTSRSDEGLLTRTIVLLSDVPEAVQSGIFGGRLPAINSGVFDGIAAAGFNFLSIRGQAGEERITAQLLRDRPRGVILGSIRNDNLARAQTMAGRLTDAGLPVVAHFDRSVSVPADRVASDHEGGAYAVAQWLAAQGRRHIQRFWPNAEDWWIRAHDRGYERAMREAGLPCLPPVIVPGLLTRQPGDRTNFENRVRQFAGFMVERLSGEQAMDAAMVVNDADAFVLIGALRLLGKKPNLDVLVAGYDNAWEDLPERQWTPTVPAVTVDKRNHRIGEELAKLLIERIEGHLPPERQYRLVPQDLVVNKLAN